MTTLICGCLGGAEAGEEVAAMLAAQVGHGRAGAAHWADCGVALGVRSTGAPDASLRMHRDSGLVVAAAARLDDREGLCGLLNIPRAEQSGLTDADLILRAYMRWGRLCPERLLGDFAFAVWDRRRRKMFCARDPVGVQPLYYAQTPTGLVFASTVAAAVAAQGVPDALDEAAVAAFLTRSTLREAKTNPGTWTLFQAVRKVPPGHALAVKTEAGRSPGALGGIRTKLERHWRPEQVPRARPASDEDYARQFLENYERAVRDRLRGADPVGVHLSGGLDSSSIAALAARALRREGRPPPLAFTWLPAPGSAPPTTEHLLIRDLCAREGLTAFHCPPSPAGLAAVHLRDGAYPGVHVHLNEEAVAHCAAARGVSVLLSGWGGDEGVSFSGRGYPAQLLFSGRWRTLHAICLAEGWNLRRFLVEVVMPLLHPQLPFHLRRHRPLWGPHSYRALERRRWFIEPAFARRVKPPSLRFFRSVGARSTQLLIMQDGRLSERMEGWAANGLRHGIEYRYPLLDRRVLEFALGLPADQYWRGPWRRWLMRHALSLPDGVAGGAVLPDRLCWHQSKNDPIRYESAMDAFAESLPILRRRLEALSDAPSRARYVDLPRLVARLDADGFRAKRHLAAISNALMLLDFK